MNVHGQYFSDRDRERVGLHTVGHGHNKARVVERQGSRKKEGNSGTDNIELVESSRVAEQVNHPFKNPVKWQGRSQLVALKLTITITPEAGELRMNESVRGGWVCTQKRSFHFSFFGPRWLSLSCRKRSHVVMIYRWKDEIANLADIHEKDKPAKPCIRW